MGSEMCIRDSRYSYGRHSRGLGLRASPQGLTSHLNLFALVTCHSLYVVFTTLQRAVFLVNSRQSQFTVAHRNGHPFFRSYGANLPSSLERFLSRSLVYSTHLPVSVYGTGLRGFLGTAAGDVFRPKPRLTYHCVCHLSAMRPMLRISTGILTCYPSTTHFGLALGPG